MEGFQFFRSDTAVAKANKISFWFWLVGLIPDSFPSKLFSAEWETEFESAVYPFEEKPLDFLTLYAPGVMEYLVCLMFSNPATIEAI